MNRERCGHQDLVSFWSGDRLLVERNSFGVYRLGAAQLYLVRGVDRVSIVNNVFRGTDPKVPGYQARVAIIVGSKGSKRVPRRVRIVNNTILTGARRIDGYAGSIRMSGVYWGLQRRKRPLLANNVIGLVQDPHHVCSVAARAVENVVLRGVACRGPNRVGPSTSRPAWPADRRVDAAHRPRQQGLRYAARHRRSPARPPAGHRRVRVPRPEEDELMRGAADAARAHDSTRAGGKRSQPPELASRDTVARFRPVPLRRRRWDAPDRPSTRSR